MIIESIEASIKQLVPHKWDDDYVDRAIRGEHYGQIQDVAEVAAPPGLFDRIRSDK